MGETIAFLGLLDSCIILLHFTEFRFVFYSLRVFFVVVFVLLFFFSFYCCWCVRVWVAVHSSFFRLIFSFYCISHPYSWLFFASYGYTDFFELPHRLVQYLRLWKPSKKKIEENKTEETGKKLKRIKRGTHKNVRT